MVGFQSLFSALIPLRNPVSYEWLHGRILLLQDVKKKDMFDFFSTEMS